MADLLSGARVAPKTHPPFLTLSVGAVPEMFPRDDESTVQARDPHSTPGHNFPYVRVRALANSCLTSMEFHRLLRKIEK